MTVSNVRIVARIEFSDYSAWLLIKLARPHSIIPVLWLVMMLWYHLAISFLRNLSEVGQFLGGSFGSVLGVWQLGLPWEPHTCQRSSFIRGRTKYLWYSQFQYS